jgi:lipopolysaccharide exporter
MLQEPLFPEIGICAVVPDQWNAMWQPRHYVLANLARYFHVLWMPPIMNGCSPRDISAGIDVSENHREELCPPGLAIYRPERWLLNLARAKGLSRITFDMKLRQARRLLMNRGCQKIILYIWRPEFAHALKSIPFDLSCYHIDDEYSFSDVEVPPNGIEIELIKNVDQVVIHSPGLIDQKGSINPNTVFIPNGVDFHAYATPRPEPFDLASIPHPRIGYTGWIKKQLDWPLLFDLTESHSEWSFIFVGPQSPHPEISELISSISKKANVHFLGPKSVEELSSYPQHFDVCIMPYRQSYYTQYIYPLKLHEYLASGRPTVGTRIRSLQEFGNVVTLAETKDDWNLALRRALMPTALSKLAVSTRQKVAQEHDWTKLVSSLAGILCNRLGSQFARQWSTLNHKYTSSTQVSVDQSSSDRKTKRDDVNPSAGRQDKIDNIDRAMTRGAIWMILARLGERSLGFISTIILVRLLAPSDFGLIAMAMSVIAIGELFNQMGLDAALIQNPNASRRHYDTAWTFTVILGSLTAAALAILAIPGANFYSEPRLVPIMLALGLGSFISGFENIGVVAFRKELQFKREFLFIFGKKLAAFFVTIPLAIMFKNYWALIGGIVMGKVAGVFLSYCVQEYRPRWSLSARKELFHFSKWMVLFNACGVFNGRAADFIIGKIAGAHALGVFNVSYEISNLPTSELIAPINRAVFPGYARKSADTSVLRTGYLDVLGMIAVFGIPAGVGIAAASQWLVPLLLGPQWTEAVPLIAILGFYGIITAMKTNADYVYLALGRPKIATYLLGIRITLLFPMLGILSVKYGSLGAAYGYLIAQLIFTPISFSVLFRILNVSAMDIIRVLWRPVVAATLMFLVVNAFIAAVPFEPDSYLQSIPILAIMIIGGLFFYIAALYFMWVVSAKPVGAESRILTAARFNVLNVVLG